jgi:hypothetical protein
MGENASNYSAIIVAAVVYMAVGFIWYSEWVLGRVWLKLMKEVNPSQMIIGHVVTFILGVVLAYVLSYFLRHLHIHTFYYGAFVGFLAWLGFIVPSKMSTVVYGGRSYKLFLIEAGFYLVALVLMGGILGVWN